MSEFWSDPNVKMLIGAVGAGIPLIAIIGVSLALESHAQKSIETQVPIQIPANARVLSSSPGEVDIDVLHVKTQ